MPIEHPPPTAATVKFLYAHAYRCAYEGCQRPLYRVDEQTGARLLNSRVCHIKARCEGGPRWDPDQSAKGNRSESNLVLMCVEHANAIDEPLTLSAFPVERLREWKAKQLEEYDRLKQGWTIDTEMAKDVIQASLSNVGVTESTVHLGGEGGRALGAGGGGGGALGHHATGGSGGPGGDINLHGTPGEAPGAGGGGAGAVGEDTVGGEGGGGGEYLSILLGPDEIGPYSGFHHFNIQVGKGGVGGPGEDTIVNLCDENGHVLRSILAKGGRAGGPAHVPPPSRSPTEEDLKAGLKVTGILAAEFIRCRDGLWTVVDGGWDWVQTATSPFRLPLPLLVEIQTGTIEPGTILNLKLAVRSPGGFQVHEQVQAVSVNDALVRRSRFVATLEFSGSQPGLWRAQVVAGDQVIGEFPIEIRVPAPDE